MHRDGLFFDPLQDEPAAPPVEQPPGRYRRPSTAELQAQRRRELERVQEELQKMAQGSGPADDD